MTGWYALRRLAQVVPALLGILVITFVIVHAAPGDPAAALAGESADPAHLAQVRAQYDLDRSLPAQFVAYAGNLATGDLGTSVLRGRPVTEVIGERLPATLLLMLTASALSILGGMALGAAAARRPFGRFDLAVTATGVVGYAMPVFWLAQVVVLVLGFRAGLFPIQGMTDARALDAGLARVLDVAHHLVLPAAVLAFSELALISRLTRTAVIGELGQDYVRTALALGMTRGRVVSRQVLPNALLPVVTVIGTRLGTVLSGAVLVETVFAWPGLGQLLVTATRSRDYPLILGLVLVVAFGVVVVNLLTDLVYGFVDPRIRYD